MKRFAPQRRWVAAILASLCVMAGAVQAADPVSSDKRLPADVLLYFSIHDMSECKAKFGGTQFGKLLKDESMADFMGQFGAPLEEVSKQVEEKTGVTLKDILAIPTGEVSIALIQSEQSPVSVVLSLNYGENEENVKKLIDKAIAEAKEAGGSTSEEEIDGTTVITVAPPKPEGEESTEGDAGGAGIEASFKSVSYALKDSTLLVSNQDSALKGLLERWKGAESGTLSSAPAYKSVMTKCTPKGDDPAEITWFVDPMGITKSVISLGSAENPQLGMVMGFLPVLGLDQLKGIGGAMNMGEGDFDNVTRTFISLDKPSRGAMRLFSMPAIEQSPAKWIHDESTMFMSLNWDLQEAYKAAEELTNTFMGEGALGKMVEDLAENEEGPKIHIKKDVIDQISGKITIAGDVTEDEEDSQERYVVALELTNEATFKKVLAKLAKLPGFPGEVREFEGHTIYDIDLGGAGGEMEEEESEDQSLKTLADDEKEESEEDEEEEAGLSPAIAIGRKSLFIGSDVEQIEEILRGKDEDSLAESDVFKKVSKYFPAKVSSMSFQRADAQVKAALEALKSGQLDAVVGDKIDLSKLPDFESISKYFTPTGGFVRPDEEGVYMETFNLKGE